MTSTPIDSDERGSDLDVLAALSSWEHWDDLTAAGRVDSVDDLTVERLVRGLAPAATVPAAGRSRRRRAGWYVGAAALVAGVVAAVVVLPSTGERPTQVAEAVVVLDRAAEAAARSTDPVIGQWWRVRSVVTAVVSEGGSGGGNAAYEMRLVRTEYLSADPTRPRYVDDSSSAVLRHVAGPVEPHLHVRPGSTVVVEPGAAGQGGIAAQAATLPREPVALRSALYADPTCAGADECVADGIRDGLVSGPLPTDLRVALFRVLATVPGVSIVDRDAELAGRRGVALAWLAGSPQDPSVRVADTTSGRRTELVIDPADGTLLGLRVVSFDGVGGVPRGTVIESRTFSRAVVDAVPPEIVARAEQVATP